MIGIAPIAPHLKLPTPATKTPHPVGVPVAVALLPEGGFSAAKRYGNDVAKECSLTRRKNSAMVVQNEVNCLRVLAQNSVFGLFFPVLKGVWQAPDMWVIHMNWCGDDMLVWLSTPRTEEERKHVLAGAAMALAVLHLGYGAHLDVKPENVAVRWAGRYWMVSLIDFGFAVCDSARKGDTRRTNGLMQGTNGYLAPEIAAGWGKGSRALYAPRMADIYSLGIMIKLVLGTETDISRSCTQSDPLNRLFDLQVKSVVSGANVPSGAPGDNEILSNDIINVCNLATRELVRVPIDPKGTDRLCNVKATLQVRKGWPVAWQCLVTKGTHLPDDQRTLAECGVSVGDTLYLLRSRWGVPDLVAHHLREWMQPAMWADLSHFFVPMFVRHDRGWSTEEIATELGGSFPPYMASWMQIAPIAPMA